MRSVEPKETIEEFYKNRPNLIPYGLQNEPGRFNVFDIAEQASPVHNSTTYRRKDFYKIKMLTGHFIFHYADKSIELEGTSLIFVHPYIPYKFEFIKAEVAGYLCIFKEEFLEHFGPVKSYPIYQPGGNPCFKVEPQDVESFRQLYLNMQSEIRSDYTFKYDLLRSYLSELMHKAMKLRPGDVSINEGTNANLRIYHLFSELLELQFPIDHSRQTIKLRTAQDFAAQMSVHINHLNRAIKQTTGKTTTQLISERLILEARALLKYTNWNIAEIGYCLGLRTLRISSAHLKAIVGLLQRFSGSGQMTYDYMKPEQMESIKKYPLGQLFGKPSEKIDFVILGSDEILALIKDDVNAHVQQYHQHDFYAISWVQNGQLQQKLDGNVFTLNPGDIFIACPGQVHENDFGLNANQVKGGAFLFTSEFLHQLRQHTAIAELTILDDVLSNPCHPLPEEDVHSFLSMIHILKKEMKKELPNLPMVRSLLCALLLSIQQTVDNSIIQANSARHIQVYKKFKHLLELHFRENKTSSFYSERLHISDRHLNRLLKEATTKTAADIILGRSILEARRLLCFTEMSISEISWSLGYQDPSYFTKLFRKLTGTTPQAYRLSIW